MWSPICIAYIQAADRAKPSLGTAFPLTEKISNFYQKSFVGETIRMTWITVWYSEITIPKIVTQTTFRGRTEISLNVAVCGSIAWRPGSARSWQHLPPAQPTTLRPSAAPWRGENQCPVIHPSIAWPTGCNQGCRMLPYGAVPAKMPYEQFERVGQILQMNFGPNYARQNVDRV